MTTIMSKTLPRVAGYMAKMAATYLIVGYVFCHLF